MIVVCDGRLNGLFAGDVRRPRFSVRLQLSVFSCILRRLVVHRRNAKFFFGGNQIVRFIFDEVLEGLHVPGINLAERLIETGKRRAMPQQGVGLLIRQLVAFKEKQDVFSHSVFVGVVQNFFGWLRKQPPFVFLLFRTEPVIQCLIQFFICRGITSYNSLIVVY